jgi:hypothetical protein
MMVRIRQKLCLRRRQDHGAYYAPCSGLSTTGFRLIFTNRLTVLGDCALQAATTCS